MDITISKSALTINDISTSSISDTLCKLLHQSTNCYRIVPLVSIASLVSITSLFSICFTGFDSIHWYQSLRLDRPPRQSKLHQSQSISIILIDRSQSFPLIDLNHSHRSISIILNHSHRSISFILIDQSQSLSSIDLFHSHRSISITLID
ncbi:hypothetical protein KEM48_006585 [Puccinia striiformis f. sp. tritici PST-130]|nr:hypothetical protein Pst134EB_020576 [Puccinia striiformis f. sp. tritici]KAI9618700.1 hypothetical protein KEM48_006585 [Puccinia striiformis f. sp. tritici PST-130]